MHTGRASQGQSKENSKELPNTSTFMVYGWLKLNTP
uniref:Uncharacterized protein n=1 Tax=Anguilla anguilla TaxID=7936 RepID=A0A0E9SCX1_ANGAN